MQPVLYCPRCASKLVTKLLEGVERQACTFPGCGFVHWDNPLPVVAALIEYRGKFLLARNAKWPRGIFSLVTGFLERKETPERAVTREVKEELGLDSEVTSFIGHYPFSEMNQIILAFSVSAAGELKTSGEIAETMSVTIEQLRVHDFKPLYITSAVVRDWLEQSPNGLPPTALPEPRRSG